MQCARAIPVTWLGSGSCQARPSRLITNEWMNITSICTLNCKVLKFTPKCCTCLPCRINSVTRIVHDHFVQWTSQSLHFDRGNNTTQCMHAYCKRQAWLQELNQHQDMRCISEVPIWYKLTWQLCCIEIWLYHHRKFKYIFYMCWFQATMTKSHAGIGFNICFKLSGQHMWRYSQFLDLAD